MAKTDTINRASAAFDWDGVITFPVGLVGCPQLKVFQLESLSDFLPIGRLSSLDVPGLSLIVADPKLWIPGYSCAQLKLDPEDLQPPDGSQLVLVIISLTPHPIQSTVNLLGPLVIDMQQQEGRQGIQSGSDYRADHPLGPHLEAWQFPKGMIGCPGWRDFLVFKMEADGSLGMLISLDQPFAALPVIDPLRVDPAYAPEIPVEDLELLEAPDADALAFYSVVNIPAEVEESKVNLLGPLVVNPATGIARQVLLANSGYDAAHPISRGEER
ncbi:MAG: flagellar assembly protein FliW [Anaerolineales bacterium]|nr:flagellar assembly protein FliW [Anaerolineales bacterium]